MLGVRELIIEVRLWDEEAEFSVKGKDVVVGIEVESEFVETTDVEMSVEDGFIELSVVWEVVTCDVIVEPKVLEDKIGELTFEVDVTMDENVVDSGIIVVVEVGTKELEL